MHHRRGVLAVLCVAQFLDVLGVTVVVVALPSIGSAFALSGSGLQLVISGYAATFGGLLLLAGRVADRHGRRRLFLLGLAVFLAGSLLCGLAWSPVVLVAARALQGLGAAVVVPAALALLTSAFPEERARARALGVWTAAAAGGGAAGFFLGGVLTDLLGWRSVFLVNVPIAGLTLLAAPRVLDESRQETAPSGGGLDLPGACAVTAGLALLVLGSSQLERHGPIAPLVTVPLALGAGLLAAFLWVERRAAAPLAPPEVLASRPLRTACLVAFVLTATTSPAATLAALYAQQVRELSPTETGLLLLASPLAVIAGSAVGPALVTRLGARTGMTGGLGAIAAAMVLLASMGVQSGLVRVAAGVGLAGLGLGVAAVASTTAGTAAVTEERQGVAAGLLNTAPQIGTALGIAALLTVAALRSGHDATPAHLVDGYRLAFLAAAALAAFGAAFVLLWRPASAKTEQPVPAGP